MMQAFGEEHLYLEIATKRYEAALGNDGSWSNAIPKGLEEWDDWHEFYQTFHSLKIIPRWKSFWSLHGFGTDQLDDEMEAKFMHTTRWIGWYPVSRRQETGLKCQWLGLSVFEMAR